MLKRFFASFVCTTMLLTLAPFTAVSVSAEEEKQLYNFDFSDESAQGELFTPTDSITIEWVKGAGVGHGDDTALKTVHTEDSPYISSSNAVMLKLTEPLPAGGVYRIVAWVYAPSAENANKDTLTGPGFVINADYPGAQGEVKFPVDFGTMPLDEWKLIDATIPMMNVPISQLDFRFVINEGPKHADVWYWDNIEIFQVGGLVEVSPPPEAEVTEEGYPVIRRNQLGTHEDFDYELWSQRKDDPVSMILTGGGTFECEWNAENILFRTGKRLGSVSTYKELGDITMEYGVDYKITKGDVNYLCVYGWTDTPMKEYYIIESHGSYKPGGSDLRGTYRLDDGTYELYVNTRVEQPSIHGTKTFEQYFGVRTSARTAGTISISEHFKEWEALGVDMSGVMYDVAFCVEGYNSSGSANVYNHVLTIGDKVYGTSTEAPAEAAEEAAEAVETEEAAETDEVAEAAETAQTDASAEADQAVEAESAETKANYSGVIIAIIGGIAVIGAVAFLLLRKTSKK